MGAKDRIKAVTRFVTTDGFEHSTMNQAADEQIAIDLERWVFGKALESFLDSEAKCVKDFIMRYRNDLLSKLRGEDE